MSDGDRTGERDAAGESGRGRAETEDGREQVETIEWVVTAVSVAFTLALVGVVVWQSVTAPADVQPRVSLAEVETRQDGRVEVTVEFVNEGRVGLASATVELDCVEPPAELVFEHVPASGHRTGTVVCPPGTGDPNATVVAWREG